MKVNFQYYGLGVATGVLVVVLFLGVVIQNSTL